MLRDSLSNQSLILINGFNVKRFSSLDSFNSIPEFISFSRTASISELTIKSPLRTASPIHLDNFFGPQALTWKSFEISVKISSSNSLSLRIQCLFPGASIDHLSISFLESGRISS